MSPLPLCQVPQDVAEAWLAQIQAAMDPESLEDDTELQPLATVIVDRSVSAKRTGHELLCPCSASAALQGLTRAHSSFSGASTLHLQGPGGMTLLTESKQGPSQGSQTGPQRSFKLAPLPPPPPPLNAKLGDPRPGSFAMSFKADSSGEKTYTMFNLPQKTTQKDQGTYCTWRYIHTHVSSKTLKHIQSRRHAVLSCICPVHTGTSSNVAYIDILESYNAVPMGAGEVCWLIRLPHSLSLSVPPGIFSCVWMSYEACVPLCARLHVCCCVCVQSLSGCLHVWYVCACVCVCVYVYVCVCVHTHRTSTQATLRHTRSALVSPASRPAQLRSTCPTHVRAH